MAITSALYAGLSGLDVNQSILNVVGNNIANANTTSFKSSRVLLSPQFYVSNSNGTPADGTFGGSNPSQEGLGAQVESVQKNFTEGELVTTGNNTDLAINGAGFFVTQGATQSFTRDGAFNLNDQHQLVDQTGSYVMGYGVDANFKIAPGALQKMTIPLGQETIAKATQNASMEGNLNAAGTVASNASVLTTQALQSSDATPITNATPVTNLEAFGGTTPLYAAGQTITLAGAKGGSTLPTQTLAITGATTVGDLQNFLSSGMGIDTAPPAGTPGPTPGGSIITDSGGGQSLVLTGNVGTNNAITIGGTALSTSAGTTPFTFTDTGGANGESATTSVTAYDSLGNPVNVSVNVVMAGKSSTGTTWDFYATSPTNQGGSQAVGNGTLTFDVNGKLTGSTGTQITLNRSGTGAMPSQNISLDFSKIQSLADTQSSLVSNTQDGFAIGTLNNFSVGQDGTITGTFSNGLTRTIGQVAVATFQNNDGLVDMGNNQYATGANSGEPTITVPGTQGTGTVLGGTLESSNVDIAHEFTNLITASTGYSAASKVISTSQQLLTDLLNMSH